MCLSVLRSRLKQSAAARKTPAAKAKPAPQADDEVSWCLVFGEECLVSAVTRQPQALRSWLKQSAAAREAPATKAKPKKPADNEVS